MPVSSSRNSICSAAQRWWRRRDESLGLLLARLELRGRRRLRPAVAIHRRPAPGLAGVPAWTRQGLGRAGQGIFRRRAPDKAARDTRAYGLWLGGRLRRR